MQKLLLLLALASSFSSFAQDDWMADYRSKKDNVLKMREKDLRADITTFTIAGISESVGKIPLRKVNYTSRSNTHMLFEGNGISAKVELAPFDSTGKRMKRLGKYLVRIDNKPFYGNYGQVPATAISKITVLYKGDTVVIPAEAYNDLYNMQFTYNDKKGTERTTNGIYLSPDEHTYYLYLLCKDNTGSYEITWAFRDKTYLRRVLDYDIFQ